MHRTTQSSMGEALRARFGTNFMDCLSISDGASGAGLLPAHSIVVLKQSVPLESQLLPRNLLTAMVVCELKRDYPDELLQSRCRSAEVRSRIKEMLAEKNGPQLANSKLKNFYSGSIGQDKGFWKPALGQTFRFSISQVDGRRGTKQQFLTVITEHPALEAELVKFAESKHEKAVEKPYTLGQLINSIQYTKARELAERNVKRVAACLAEALGVEIASEIDQCANPTPSVVNGKIVYSTARQAVPLGISFFNHLASFNYSCEGKQFNAVGIFSDCGSIAAGSGTPVFPVNPFDGIGWINDFKAETHHGLPNYNAQLLAASLPCGAPHIGANAIHTAEDHAFIRRSLASSTCEALQTGEELVPSLSREFIDTKKLLEPIRTSLPKDVQDVRLMWHVFSTVQ